MPVLSSEAVVLRTWPVHEADLIVSFFTREYGRMRGVAKAALKSRKRFGGALEPMTLARAWFVERPGQDLVRLDQLEIIRSPLSAPVDQARMAVLSFYAEVIDEALPERDPQDAVFRLLVAVLEQTHAVDSGAEFGVPRVPRTWGPGKAVEIGLSEAGGTEVGVPLVPTLGPGRPVQPQVGQPWMALTYFSLWMTRLMGLLPDIARCIVCGEAFRTRASSGDPTRTSPGHSVLKGHDLSRAENAAPKDEGALAPEVKGTGFSPYANWPLTLGALAPEEHRRSGSAFFSPHADGLFCALHRNGSASALSADSWQMAQRMLHAPASAFASEPWTRKRGQDLRRFTLQTLERHLEKKLKTAEALARLGG